MEPGEMSVHRAQVVWSGGEAGDVRAHEVRLADQAVDASCAAALGGDPSKADPEEMFVAALSSCHTLWFLALARAEKIRVTVDAARERGDLLASFARCLDCGKHANLHAPCISRLTKGLHGRVVTASSRPRPGKVDAPANLEHLRVQADAA